MVSLTDLLGSCANDKLVCIFGYCSRGKVLALEERISPLPTVVFRECLDSKGSFFFFFLKNFFILDVSDQLKSFVDTGSESLVVIIGVPVSFLGCLIVWERNSKQIIMQPNSLEY